MPHDQPVISVEGRDGHRFELIHVAAGQPRHSLLFLPGMGLSARLFIHFARALADKGISVFLHEWRGNGSSNLRASRQSNWGYRELLDDIVAARRTVAERTSGGYLLGGHSLGAQFACLSAAVDFDRLEGLVLVAGGAPYWRAYPLLFRPVMVATMLAFPSLGALFGFYPGRRVGFGGNEARGVMADWGRSARTGKYRPNGVDQNLEAGMRALKLPVVALAMADDWLVPPGALGWLTGKLAGCEISRRLIEADTDEQKADHYSWMEQPDDTARAIEKWLTGANT